MSNFKENYSKYYDIIYTNKNYKKETKLIKKIIKKYSSNSKDLLDMVCGTGRYSSLLTKQGENPASKYFLLIASANSSS